MAYHVQQLHFKKSKVIEPIQGGTQLNWISFVAHSSQSTLVNIVPTKQEKQKNNCHSKLRFTSWRHNFKKQTVASWYHPIFYFWERPPRPWPSPLPHIQCSGLGSHLPSSQCTWVACAQMRQRRGWQTMGHVVFKPGSLTNISSSTLQSGYFWTRVWELLSRPSPSISAKVDCNLLERVNRESPYLEKVLYACRAHSAKKNWQGILQSRFHLLKKSNHFKKI